MPEEETVELGITDLSGAVKVGAGGFGTVYKAHQESLHREVAVKMVSATITDEKVRIRFEREIAAMGMLSGHPNIVTVYDSGYTESGQPYILMDYMEGGSLGDQMEEHGALPWQELLPLMVKVSGALETAHKAGILHRDIKPENVLVNAYGEPKLGDFGIARLKGGPETGTSSLTASIEHVAPELLDARPPSVSSDLYALGSTMFKLLVGQSAFVHKTDESIVPALSRIQSQPVPDLRGRGVPDPVCELLETVMAKDPAARHLSAAAFGSQIQDLQRQLGLSVTPLPIRDADAKRARAATQVIHSNDLLPPTATSSGSIGHSGPQMMSGPVQQSSPFQAPSSGQFQVPPSGGFQVPPSGQFPAPSPGATGPQPFLQSGGAQGGPYAQPGGQHQPQQDFQSPPGATRRAKWPKVLIGVVVLAALVGGGIALTRPKAPELPEDYAFEEVTDQTSSLRVEVPQSWDDVQRDAWEISGTEVGVQVIASPDIRDFRRTWNQPGVIFGASTQLAEQFTVTALLDQLAVDFLDQCDFDGAEDYEDNLYTGTRHDYSDCGRIGTSYHIIAATPNDGREVLLVLQVQAVEDRDDAVLEQAIATFAVDRDFGG